MFLDTCLTILDIAEKATNLFDWFTGVSAGDQMKSQLDSLKKQHTKIERLSDNILYAADFQQVINIERNQPLNDKKKLHDLLTPLSREIDGDVLVSTVSLTPEKLKRAFKKDPWEVLIDPRPIDRVKLQNNPDLVPIGFFENNIHYIGWQTRGVLPSMFDCEFDPTGAGILLPTSTLPIVETNDDAFEKAAIAFFDELVNWLSFHTEKESYYFGEEIPDSLLYHVGGHDHLHQEEQIFAAIDLTLSKSGKDYVAFGHLGMYYHNPWEADQDGDHFIPYHDFVNRNFAKPWLFEVTLDKNGSINTAGCSLSRADIVLILNGVKKVAQRHYNVALSIYQNS